MAIDHQRRALLCALPGAAAFALLPGLARAAVPGETQYEVLTCWSDDPLRPRAFHAGLLSAPQRALSLPARGHAVQWHPRNRTSAFVAARRPGSFLVHWRIADGEVLARFDAEDDLYFEGHIAFDAGGKRLFATETDAFTGEGRIGVYDADTLERIDAWPTHGIGPHEVTLLSNGLLAVANGGILTLPETGRVKRNLDTMDPSLVLLDPRDGTLLEQHRLPDHRMSIRHIAQADDGTIGVALQNEGEERLPLFAFLKNGRLHYGEADEDVLNRCGTYAGDIAALGDHFAVSCTLGGVTAIWNSRGKAIAQAPTPRVCALAPMKGGWFASADVGTSWCISMNGKIRNTSRHDIAWDNHAIMVPVTDTMPSKRVAPNLKH